MRLGHWAIPSLLGLGVSASIPTPATEDSKPWTQIHEEGRCAIQDQCGKKSFFGKELPCAYNGLAEDPEDDVRDKLVSICGDEWKDSKVCCTGSQLDALRSNLKTVDGFISACPACESNFFKLFCTFTCSPDQSTFINVTSIEEKSGKYLAAELDHLVSDEYGSTFYDSCKDVKFGALGDSAMKFIGGGAKNYTQFLKFLGDEKPFGSPFQMNFPRPEQGKFPDMKPQDMTAHPCNDPDEKYRCACVDCAEVCPDLPAVTEAESCHVGVLPCLSFAVIIIYSISLLLLVAAVSAHVAIQKHNRNKNERLRLLQDAAPSDDEDEGDIIHSVAMLDRPTKPYWLNTLCDRAFSKLGLFCAKYPAITIVASVLVVGLLSIGWVNFEVETDPVRLWVSPDSAAAQEKQFFDDNFGPFYRAEQAFLVNDTDPSGPGPVLSYETLLWWLDVESRIERLKSFDTGTTLQDVCYKPQGDSCVIQSVSGYFKAKGGLGSNWDSILQECVDSPVNCLPPFGLPLEPNMILGGFNGTENVLDAQALIVTWVVKNHREGAEELKLAEDWESSLESLLLVAVQNEARDRGLRLSFNTEISLEKELNKSTNTDAKIVVISYVIMFVYASIALGSTTLAFRTIIHRPSSALVESKFMLGVVGIIIVLMSVSASVGLFSAAGIKVTLIIAEVIPFLVLAVGVDNIFLIVHEFERVNVTHPDGPVHDRVSKALGRMGPSILLSATTETVAFAMGAAVGMPAVRNFAAYAAGAVLINALLQITMFVAVLALNQRRVEDGRADCFPCIRARRSNSLNVGGVPYGMDEEGTFQRFIRRVYAPALLGKKVKVVIVAFFLALFATGIGLIPTVELGLDQRIAIPNGSYLIDYFNDLYAYFNTGPPVYFVTRELNVTERQHQQELCSRFSTCETFSMVNVIEQERKRTDVSYLATTAASWIDDFLFSLKPELGCCMDGGKPCFEGRDPPWNLTMQGMPEDEEFMYYLDRWLHTPADKDCAINGDPAYTEALVLDKERLTIPASHFRTAHTPLRSQEDFIASYAAARRIANTLKDTVSTDVFPYSKHYIFFDQYTDIVRLTLTLLGSGLAMILVVTSLLLGSVLTGLVVTLTVAMIVVDVAGTMAVAKVSLNAVSLVNLVICLGIGVEFCAHIARAFAFPSRSLMERAPGSTSSSSFTFFGSWGAGARPKSFRGRDARAWTALVNVAGSVFSGITITKLLGVVVLAFTRSKIFEVYYFRIWLALVIFAALHALVFLPVALSLVGGAGMYPFCRDRWYLADTRIGYLDPEGDGGLEQDLRSRRYPALLDEDYDSDEF
jgi:Niemann-Pick C1 protein